MSVPGRALITGATQGLGLVLARQLAAAGWQLILTSRREAAVKAVSHELAAHTRTLPCPGNVADVNYYAHLDTGVMALGGLDLILHCAADTDVDGCARNPERAYRTNALGTQNIALACRAYGAEMVHISTNEVFAGDQPDGYEEWMLPYPVNAYGRSKAAAEFYVRHTLNRFYIVRTAWMYAPDGRNFIHAVLDQARQNGRLQVVVDEIGSPTAVVDLADAIIKLIDTHQYGIYHFVNAGHCSRYQFAQAILCEMGLLQVVITPILRTAYKRPSTPPAWSILHNTAGKAVGIELPPWQDALAAYLRNER